jgi:predicted negative regulator of RcsB-dependent stress response
VSTAQSQRTEEKDPVVVALEWIKHRRNPLIAGGTIVVMVAFSAWFFLTAQQRKEAFAASELANARAVAAAGNLALAASDLDALITNYGGTEAGEEATLLLAQIRLMEGQADAAIIALQRLLDAGPSAQFRAPVRALLGTALEESGSYSEAAQSYLTASDGAWYGFLKAQYLVDAGRAYELAGDDEAAAGAYQRVLSEFPEESQFVVEAKVRLAELRPSGSGIKQ